MGDFAPAPTSVLGDFVLTDAKAETRPSQPQDIETFRRCVENQTDVWCMFFGQEYRTEREECLVALIDLHEDAPELFSLPFVLATWEAFTYDYVYKMFEGMRRLSQFCRPPDDIVEIRRLALNRHPDGGVIWQPPFSFDMSPSQGYRRRNIIPRLEAGVGRQGYAVALEKVLGKGNVKGRGRLKGNQNSTVGAANKDLFPLTEKMSKGEMNMALQNCHRKAKSVVALRLDYNAHAGCSRGNDCRFCHEYFGGKNLHWCVEAELIRRGGFRKRKSVISDVKEARTLITDLRGKNARILGEQILESNQGASGATVGGLGRTNQTSEDMHLCYRTNPAHVPICPALDLPEFASVGILQNPTNQTPVDCAWWGGEDQRKVRKQAPNQYFTSMPVDFEHFDFVESEQLINDLVHTTDAWTYPITRDGVPVKSDALSSQQQRIDSFWTGFSSVVDPSVHSFVVNWLNVCCGDQMAEPTVDMIGHSLTYLQEHGSDRDEIFASNSLGRLDRTGCAVGKTDCRDEIVWGSKVGLIDAESEELSFGALRFHVLDFGDVLELNGGLRFDISRGDSTEKNQWALLAMAAGIEWSLQKRPQRAPSRTRVQSVSRELRGEEIAMAKRVNEPMPRVLMSAVHDVVSLGNDRDIRVFNWFLVPIVRGYVQCEIRIVEISRNQKLSVAHFFPCANAAVEPLFFVAFLGHLRWMMPTMSSRPEEWEMWRRSFHQAVEQLPEEGFEFKSRYVELEVPPYKKRPHFPSWLKVDINDWCVGALNPDGTASATKSAPVSRSTNRMPRVINGAEVFPPPTILAPAPRASIVNSSANSNPNVTSAVSTPLAPKEPAHVSDDTDLGEVFDAFPHCRAAEGRSTQGRPVISGSRS